VYGRYCPLARTNVKSYGYFILEGPFVPRPETVNYRSEEGLEIVGGVKGFAYF
jgi:hypothetical protein